MINNYVQSMCMHHENTLLNMQKAQQTTVNLVNIDILASNDLKFAIPD